MPIAGPSKLLALDSTENFHALERQSHQQLSTAIGCANWGGRAFVTVSPLPCSRSCSSSWSRRSVSRSWRS